MHHLLVSAFVVHLLFMAWPTMKNKVKLAFEHMCWLIIPEHSTIW